MLFLQGIAENDEIVAFVRVCSCLSSLCESSNVSQARAIAESNIANSLVNPALTGKPGSSSYKTDRVLMAVY